MKLAALLKSDDQPRDELGRFASAGALSSVEAKQVEDQLAAIERVKEGAGHFNVEGEPEVSLVNVPGFVRPEKGQRIFGFSDKDLKQFRAVEIPLSGLEFGQSTVHANHLLRQASQFQAKDPGAGVTSNRWSKGSPDTWERELPQVVRVGGKYVVQDGHHRLALQSLAGRKTANVALIDFDEETGTYSAPAKGRKALGKVSLAALLQKGPVDDAAPLAATSPLNPRLVPTEAQASAGNYRKPRARVAGLRFTLENPAGSLRRPEWPPLSAHYGYVRGTEGADGDHVDVLVRPGTEAGWDGTVWVVDQVDASGKFDEHKCLVGYDSQREAERAYLANYPRGWNLGPVTGMQAAEFRRWLRAGDTKLPAGSWRP